MKKILPILFVIGLYQICICQVQKFSGIYIEYKRTLWNGDDGSDYTFEGKPFKTCMQFDFKTNGDKVIVYNASIQNEQTYTINNDTLVFTMEIGNGENIRTIYTKYIILENKDELIIREFKGLLDDNYYLRKFHFKKSSTIQQDYLKKNSYEIYTMVEEMPNFPGGSEEMKKFIANEVNKSNLKGQEKIFLKLLVAPSGKIESLEILNNPKIEYVKEAVKIIRKFPDFIPGKQNGSGVYVYFNLPVKFI